MRHFFCVAAFVALNRVAFCQLTVSGLIKPSPAWEKKLYVIRIDRIGVSAPVLIDSIRLNTDGAFTYTFAPDPQGMLYELRLPPVGGNYKTVVSGVNDNWIHVVSDKKTSLNLHSSDSLFYSAVMEGDCLNKQLQTFKNFKQPLTTLFGQLNDSIQKNPSKKERYKETYSLMVLQALDILKKRITQVLDTASNTSIIAAGIYYLNEASINHLTFQQIKKYADRLTNEDVLLVKNIKQLEHSTASNRVGLKLVETALLTTNGDVVTLSTIEGKYKLIDFWASWCGPCRYANKNQLPELNTWLTERKISLIGVSIDTDDAKWKEAVRKDNTNWLQLRDATTGMRKLLSIGGVPIYLVVDENNVVVFEASSTFEVKIFLLSK